MIVAIADTHTAIWYLFSDPRRSRKASAFIDDTIAVGDHIGVSAISFAEMVYLIEKGRIPAAALNDLHAAIADPLAVLPTRSEYRRGKPSDKNLPPGQLT